jgi:lycopene beta-cyclase
MQSYDLVIAGGGLSGWSLAAQLAYRGWDRPVLLVDDPQRHPSAQVWAFWSREVEASSGIDLLSGAVSRSYQRIRVYADGEPRELSLGRYRYCVVRRCDLVRTAEALVDQCRIIEVRRGRVQGIHDRGDHAVVVVDGEPVRCRWAFDSVSKPGGVRVDARLAFTGWEVHTAAAVFDPNVPVLFDFRTPQGSGLDPSAAPITPRFVYVLPLAPDHALVELTEFVPRHGEPARDHERTGALAQYLVEVVGAGDYETLRTESAVLPLLARPLQRRKGRVFAIGATAGLVKASTGYAYQRIQRDSSQLAASLVQYGRPVNPADRRHRHRLLDAVLLDVLDRDATQLEVAFARLFGRNPAERVLSFLDETSTIVNDLRIMASLPPGPYLRALALLPCAARAPTELSGRTSAVPPRAPGQASIRMADSPTDDTEAATDAMWLPDYPPPES